MFLKNWRNGTSERTFRSELQVAIVSIVSCLSVVSHNWLCSAIKGGEVFSYELRFSFEPLSDEFVCESLKMCVVSLTLQGIVLKSVARQWLTVTIRSVLCFLAEHIWQRSQTFLTVFDIQYSTSQCITIQCDFTSLIHLVMDFGLLDIFFFFSLEIINSCFVVFFKKKKNPTSLQTPGLMGWVEADVPTGQSLSSHVKDGKCRVVSPLWRRLRMKLCFNSNCRAALTWAGWNAITFDQVYRRRLEVRVGYREKV